MTVESLRLLGPRLLVKRDAPETETDSGLAIPAIAQTPKDKVLYGTVAKIGTGTRLKNGNRSACAVEPGQRVMFGFLDGEDIELGGGEQYVILQDSEVRAIMGESATSDCGICRGTGYDCSMLQDCECTRRAA